MKFIEVTTTTTNIYVEYEDGTRGGVYDLDSGVWSCKDSSTETELSQTPELIEGARTAAQVELKSGEQSLTNLSTARKLGGVVGGILFGLPAGQAVTQHEILSPYISMPLGFAIGALAVAGSARALQYQETASAKKRILKAKTHIEETNKST